MTRSKSIRGKASANRAKASVRQRLREFQLESLEPRLLLTTFYVDDSAASGGTGTFSSPFDTIQSAANVVNPGDTVEIRAGVYREEVVVPRSGTVNNPITFQAYNNEDVVVSGADLVTGWTQYSGNVWVANANWNAGGSRSNNTLFVDGVLQQEARQGAENDFFNINDWGQLPRNRLANNASSFRVDDLGGFPNDYWNGANIKFHTHDWVVVERTITDFSSNGTITFDSPVGVVSQKQVNGYYIYDALNAVDETGEWYKQDGGDALYYQVAPGQNPNNLEIELKRRASAFDVRSRDYIEIKGIELRGASIETNSSTDHNVYEGNEFYAYDINNYGRFYVEGDHNLLRDNEFSHVYGSIASVGGQRNAFVNNYIHHIGYSPTARVINATGADEFLFSHNTVSTFARSFMDGYPTRSEIAHNIFENGGNLSWDTGVFDADGGNGDSSYSIFHHNIFRDTNTRGIFEGFYGRNSNSVIHHNLFHDFDGGGRTVFRSYGLDFRQAFHNTVITDQDGAPSGELNAIEAIQTRYNNNVQLTAERMAALGVDVRGNYDYSTSDFVSFFSDDYRLASNSPAIDTGILVPGINDNYSGTAPDPGAFEFGQAPWTAGHDFLNEPNPVYAWQPLPGTNVYDNGQFLEGIGDWTILSGTPVSQDRNSWNLQSSGAGLTGTFRTRSVELTPGEAISRTFTGLAPNTTYTLGTGTRLVNEITVGNQTGGTSGVIQSGSHRGVGYVTEIDAGEWVRYINIDFGDPGQFDQLDLLHIRDPQNNFLLPIDGVGVQVRLDSPTGPLLAEFSELTGGLSLDRWRADRVDMSAVSGLHTIYVSTTGANGGNIALGSMRLLKDALPTSDLLTTIISSPGAEMTSAQVGKDDWERGYEEVVFTTGPTATTAEVQFRNDGRLNAYLDKLYLIEGHSTRGQSPSEVSLLSLGATAELSLTPTTVGPAAGVLDSDLNNVTQTGDHPGSWLQVNLSERRHLHAIKLSPANVHLDQLSNFRVSVWSEDPRVGGIELWQQDYLTDGQSLVANESLLIQGDTFALDGLTQLKDVSGRFVRLQLLGQTNNGDHQLAVGEVQVFGFGENNWALSDGIATQSTTSGGLVAENANDGDSATRSETSANGVNSWWQVRFAQGFAMGEIELVNHNDPTFADLSDFTVSVWDEDPAAGGSKIWEKSYFSTGSVGQGESLVIEGSEVANDGMTRLATAHRGKVVRVQLNGTNNQGNGRLSMAEVRVTSANNAAPIANAAQKGIAAQETNFYGDSGSDYGFAVQAVDGVISPVTNFTSTIAETGTWWQVDLQDTPKIDQIVVFNRTDSANRLNNFRVSVWNDNPESGGSELWGRTYFYSSSAPFYSTSSIGAGGALLINGSVTDGGVRLDSVTGGRFVRVQLNGSNILSLAEVQVWTPFENYQFSSGQTIFNFDFGSTTSPVQSSSWMRVSPNTTGDVQWSHSVGAEYQPSVNTNNINRDFVTGTSPTTLTVDVPDGIYSVVANLGDGLSVRDNMLIWAQGQLLDGDVDSSPTGTPFPQVTGQVEVRNGVFSLQLDDAGDSFGSAPGWAITRLSLTRIGNLPPGPDNALQLLVDSEGGAVLKNTTGQSLWLEGYTITSGTNALMPNDWISFDDQEYDGAGWVESTATGTSLSEAGAAIAIPNNGQIYIGRVLDSNTSQLLGLQYQLAGSTSTNGYFAFTDIGAPLLVGDFSQNLIVDAADFTIWRDNLGAPVAPFALADANGDARIDQSDRLVWVALFGDSVATTNLIDANVGNGSFEDWGAQNGATRVLTNNGTVTTPGWTATTTNVGGWLAANDSSATSGANSDGSRYGFAAGGASVTLTSDPLNYAVSAGESLVLNLDAGSKDGVMHSYDVSLLFGGQERNVGSFVEGSNATTAGLANHELSYTVTAVDAGQLPVLKIVISVSNSFSQAFVDNVHLQVLGGNSTVLATNASIDPIVGDVNSDGVVDSDDLGRLLNQFDADADGWSDGNFNGDGKVDSLDLGLLLNELDDANSQAFASFSTRSDWWNDDEE